MRRLLKKTAKFSARYAPAVFIVGILTSLVWNPYRMHVILVWCAGLTILTGAVFFSALAVMEAIGRRRLVRSARKIEPGANFAGPGKAPLSWRGLGVPDPVVKEREDAFEQGVVLAKPSPEVVEGAVVISLEEWRRRKQAKG